MDKMLALTSQIPTVQIANIVMPSAEERAKIDALHRALDAIAPRLREASDTAAWRRNDSACCRAITFVQTRCGHMMSDQSDVLDRCPCLCALVQLINVRNSLKGLDGVASIF